MPEGAVAVPIPEVAQNACTVLRRKLSGLSAQAHRGEFLRLVALVLELAGLRVYPDQGRCADIWRAHPRLSLLREITGLSEAEMESLREMLVPGCILRWKRPKVCPSCLREQSWCRKAWDVLPFTVCPLHRVTLIDSCPHCYQTISWTRKSVSVCRCGYDWRRISRPVIGVDGELTAARRMVSIWGHKAVVDFQLEDAIGRPLTRKVSAAYPDSLCALADAWPFLKHERSGCRRRRRMSYVIVR